VFVAQVAQLLDDIQSSLFDRALAFRRQHTMEINDRNEFNRFFTPANPEKPEIHGGFAMAQWCGNETCEAAIKNELNVTIRCIPIPLQGPAGPCICCGRPSPHPVVYAKAY
jgi:prolyl-tRNA synthetase